MARVTMPSMTRNTSWALAGNSVYAACQWIVFILLARSLQMADVGLFAYALAITGPIFVLANVRLRNLLATGTRSPRDFSDYLVARLLTTAIAIAASLFTAAIVSFGAGAFAVMAMMTVAKAVDAVSDICHGLFQRELDMRSAAVGLIANGVFSVVLVGLTLVFWPSVVGATAAYAFGSGAALLAWDLPRMAAVAYPSGLATRATLLAARQLIVIALPLGFSTAVGSLKTNLPRYVVASALGPAALAVFAAVSYIATIGDLIVNAIAQAALPLLTRDLRMSAECYRHRLFRLVATGSVLGVASVLCLAFVGQPLLASVYSADYAAHVDVLLWLMSAAALTYAYLFLGTGATARRNFGSQFLISLVGLSVVAGSIGPLVGRFGLLGAAWSLLLAAAVELGSYAALTMNDLRALRAEEPITGIGSGALAESAGS